MRAPTLTEVVCQPRAAARRPQDAPAPRANARLNRARERPTRYQLDLLKSADATESRRAVSTELPSITPARGATAPTVSLELESKPETLTLVRGMLAGVAELLAMDPELLDDLKTAVSEACNNVALHAYPDGLGPLAVLLSSRNEGIEVIVRDHGLGISEDAAADDRVLGVGLPVIRALTEHAEFRARPEGGTEAWMLFAGKRDGRPLFRSPTDAAPDDGWSKQLSGDAVVSVSPVALLSGVLGRISRALAANARFSLDRFSDVYLVTDAVAAHAAKASAGARICFAVTAGGRRLELIVGPFRTAFESDLRAGDPSAGTHSPLAKLSDELDLIPAEGCELLRIVMIDHRQSS
jgi:serine/threonine-protein kinase RsbW